MGGWEIMADPMTISFGVFLLLLRRMGTDAQGLYRAVPGEQTRMTYYASAIVQWWEPAVSRECPGPIGEQPS